MRETYRYGIQAIVALVSVALLVAFSIFVLARASAEYRVGDWRYFAVFVPVMGLFLLGGVLAARDVVISDEGIGRSLFGVTVRFVRWEDVLWVQCGDFATGYGGKDRYYSLHTGRKHLLSAVRFRSSIKGVEALVTKVRAEITRRDIPVMTRRTGALTPIDRVPGPSELVGG
jgi:hypothetical protein